MPPSTTNTRYARLLFAVGTSLLMSALLAQTPQGQKSTGIPDGGTREVLVSIFIPSLPGMPFTATVDTEWVRFLSDGTRTALTNHRMVARDNQIVANDLFEELPPTQGPVEDLRQTDFHLPDRQVPLVARLSVFRPQGKWN